MTIGSKHGETMHTTFSVNVYNNQKNKECYLKTLFPLLKHVDLIVMDEISMTSAEQFATIDSNMRRALQLYRAIYGEDELSNLSYDKPFVGKHFICLGDFQQIPPIGATSLNEAMIQLSVSQKLSGGENAAKKMKNLAGAHLFKHFVAKFLTLQVRSSADPEHTKFIQSFSTEQYPITMEHVKRIQDYNEECVMKNPNFEFAVVLVSTHSERHYWNEKRALQYAKKTKIVVTKYYNPHREYGGGYESCNAVGVPPTSRNQEMDNKRKGFASYLFEGAPMMITVNVKNKDTKETILANGQFCRCMSWTFDDEWNELADNTYNSVPDDEFSIVTLPQPRYIHVFIDGEFIVSINGQNLTITNSDFERQMNPNHNVGQFVYIRWDDLFLKSNPKLQSWKGYCKAKIKKIIKQGFIFSATHNVNAKDPVRRMQVCLAFSFTFNKCQGMTLPCVVLSIADVPGFCKSYIKLFHLYVILSRVTAGKYLAKLPGTDASFQYLTKLEFPPAVSMWRKNYDANGKWVNGVKSTFVSDIVKQLKSVESLDRLDIDELRRLAKLLGEAVFNLKRQGLIKKLLPWFKLANQI